MLKQFTYRSKNRLLAGGVVLFVLICYQLAIKKTIELHAECTQLDAQVQAANDAPAKIKELKKEKDKIDGLIGKESTSGELQQTLLGVVTNYCKDNNVVLDNFPSPLLSNKGGIILVTNMFEVEGDFGKLLKLEYLFEQGYKMGKVVSVDYKAKRNYDSKKYSLTITIYIQNIKKNNSNET